MHTVTCIHLFCKLFLNFELKLILIEQKNKQKKSGWYNYPDITTKKKKSLFNLYVI